MAQTKEGAIIIAAKKANLSVDEYKIKSEKEKKCCKCKVWKPKEKFNTDNSRWDKLTSKCHDCIRVKEKKCWKGRVSTFKGKHHTKENKRKASERMKAKGAKSPMEGKNHTLESRKKMSETKRINTKRGKYSHSYKHGQSVEIRGIRFSSEYKRWRYDVFSRDNFTCQDCGDNKGGNLNAHHKKPFSEYPELRFDIDNGITLCEIYHDKKHFKKDSIRNKIKVKKGIPLKF